MSMPLIGGAFVLVGMSALGIWCDDPKAYLTPNGELKQKLTLREEQGGIAGPRVHIYTIEPSGKWTILGYTRYTNKAGEEQKKGVTEHKGKLTQEELVRLSKELAAKRVSELPREIGRPAKVNPRSITVGFGDKESKLLLEPQGGKEAVAPKADDAEAEARNRLTSVAQTIRQVVQPKKP